MAKTPKFQGPKDSLPATTPDVAAEVESEEDDDFLPGEGPENSTSESEGNSVTTDTANSPEVEANSNLVVGELANSVLANATPIETRILNPDSLPLDAMHVKVMVESALKMAEAYNAQRINYVTNTSGREAKAEAYTKDLFANPDGDPEGSALAVELRDAEAALKQAQEIVDAAKDKLSAHVDAKLSESDTVWDKETEDTKFNELQAVFKALRGIRVSTADMIDSYNSHRRPGTPDIGTIDNYVPPIEKPSGGISTASARGIGGSSTTGSTGRAPHIARAEIMYPGDSEYTWAHRRVGKNDVSNAEIVASVLTEKTGTKVSKEDVQAAWLGAFGTSVENLNKELVPIVADFDMVVDGVNYPIRITRKVRNPQVDAEATA